MNIYLLMLYSVWEIDVNILIFFDFNKCFIELFFFWGNGLLLYLYVILVIFYCLISFGKILIGWFWMIKRCEFSFFRFLLRLCKYFKRNCYLFFDRLILFKEFILRKNIVLKVELFFIVCCRDGLLCNLSFFLN